MRVRGLLLSLVVIGTGYVVIMNKVNENNPKPVDHAAELSVKVDKILSDSRSDDEHNLYVVMNDYLNNYDIKTAQGEVSITGYEYKKESHELLVDYKGIQNVSGEERHTIMKSLYARIGMDSGITITAFENFIGLKRDVWYTPVAKIGPSMYEDYVTNQKVGW